MDGWRVAPSRWLWMRFKQVTTKRLLWIWNSTWKACAVLTGCPRKGKPSSNRYHRHTTRNVKVFMSNQYSRAPSTVHRSSRSLSTPQKSNDSYDTKLRQEQICSLFDISFVGARHRFSLCFCFHFSKTIFFIAFLPLHCKSLRLFDCCSVRVL